MEASARGDTLRRIAMELTADGIPTPTGKRVEWSPVAVEHILTHPTYCGQVAALRNQYVPVEKHLRAQYADKTRRIDRPMSEQIPLPARCAPALVSAELAAAVAKRLVFNQRTALRNNHYPERSLLRGGFARCGDCRGALGVKTTSHRLKSGNGAPYLRTRYCCNRSLLLGQQCRARVIEARLLDGVVWAKVCEILRHPEIIEHELEQMRATAARGEQPGVEQVAQIDERVARLGQRIANLRRLAEQVDDPDQTRQLAEDIAKLVAEKRATEAERVAAQAHFAEWQQKQEGLQQTMDYCQRVAGNLDTFTYDEKRTTLAALGAVVWLYRADHTPRAELEIHLPLSGARQFDLLDADCVNMHSPLLAGPGAGELLQRSRISRRAGRLT
ncbi:MAG TPA: recombinase family protein [Ktedonobacterales bacterium]|nr:recombinase family protein [Ktedonobacterales bacterium]